MLQIAWVWVRNPNKGTLDIFKGHKSLLTTSQMILQRVDAGFVPLRVQPHQVHPISTQLD